MSNILWVRTNMLECQIYKSAVRVQRSHFSLIQLNIFPFFMYEPEDDLSEGGPESNLIMDYVILPFLQRHNRRASRKSNQIKYHLCCSVACMSSARDGSAQTNIICTRWCIRIRRVSAAAKRGNVVAAMKRTLQLNTAQRDTIVEHRAPSEKCIFAHRKVWGSVDDTIRRGGQEGGID